MIDIRLIRENPEFVKENIKKKFQDEKIKLVDEVLSFDKDWRQVKKQEDDLRSERNKVSNEINIEKKKKNEKKTKELLKKAKHIPGKIFRLQEKRKKLEEKIKERMLKIPNIIHESVPIGKDEGENVEVRKIGEPKVPGFKIFHHAELAEKLKGADFESAREVSGHGFYYLMGDLAQLSSALINYARDYMINQGFLYVEPPLMIRTNAVDGVMSFEEKDVMMYKIEDEDLYLIGTSEHALISMFTEKVLNGKELPLKITGYSPCFRKEVGAHGIEEKGFYRVHQFYKQEMIVITEPKNSYEWYERMLNITIGVFKSLGIPIRVLEICSGDLSDLKAKSCDVEAWSPRQKKYFEVGSLTNTEEAQARRLNIRVEYKGRRYYPHILNNTVLATPRVLIAILENFQQKDGSVLIPKVLWPYMNGKKVIGKK